MPSSEPEAVEETAPPVRIVGWTETHNARRFQERFVLQNIDGVMHHWKERHFELPDGAKLMAIELLLPVNRKLTAPEAGRLLNASRPRAGRAPDPQDAQVIPASIYDVSDGDFP